MTTEFLLRKRAARLAFTLCLSVLFFSLFYAFALSKATVVPVDGAFYFLVSTKDNLQASKEEAYLLGGAGYLLTIDESPCVSYAVYSSQEVGRTHRTELEHSGKEVALREYRLNDLYFKTPREKRNAHKVKNMLGCLKTCTEVLGELAQKAESGEYTQETLKASLRVLRSVLSGLSKRTAEGYFEGLRSSLSEINCHLEEKGKDIVFAKDLRYAQVALSEQIILLCHTFLL